MARQAPFSRLQGLEKDAERSVLDALNSLLARIQESATDEPVTTLKSSDYVARLGDVARMRAGTKLSLPPANPASAGKVVALLIEGDGFIGVSAQAATIAGARRLGTVNGVSVDSVSGPGLVNFRSNGDAGWLSSASAESGAASVALEAVAQSALLTWGEVLDAGDRGDWQFGGVAGVAAQVLTSNGPGRQPTWQATLFPTAGNSLSYTGSTLNYVGSSSTINLVSASGALGVVDISALQCGGSYTIQAIAAAATISGFTAKTDGFWFSLDVRDNATTAALTLLHEVSALATDIRCSRGRDWPMSRDDHVVLYYCSNRWRIQNVWQNPRSVGADSVTWAAQQDNVVLTGTDTGRIRVTLTGSQNLSGVVPLSNSPGGQMLLIENIDTVDSLTILHDSTSTAANRFFCVNSASLVLPPNSSVWCCYDSTISRWRPTTGAIPADMAANSIKANATAATAAAADLAVGANTVVGRVAGNIVAASLVAAQVATNTLTAATQTQMAARTSKGNNTNATANEIDLTADQTRECFAGGCVTQSSALTQTNSTTNLTPGSYSIPANMPQVGSEYALEGYFHVSRGATATAANLVIELLINGTVIRTITLAIVTTASTFGHALVRGRITVRTTGAGGTCMVTLSAEHTVTIMTTTPETISPRRAMTPAPGTAAPATTAIDTTVARTIELRARMDAAVAALTVYAMDMTIKKIR